MNDHEIYEKWMRFALVEAIKAFDCGEVPIGCVVVKENRIEFFREGDFKKCIP